MTRPCLCGLAVRPRRLFGFTAREAVGGAPSFRTVLSDLGGSGLPPTFTPTTLLAGVSKIQGGRSPPPSELLGLGALDGDLALRAGPRAQDDLGAVVAAEGPGDEGVPPAPGAALGARARRERRGQPRNFCRHGLNDNIAPRAHRMGAP